MCQLVKMTMFHSMLMVLLHEAKKKILRFFRCSSPLLIFPLQSVFRIKHKGKFWLEIIQKTETEIVWSNAFDTRLFLHFQGKTNVETVLFFIVSYNFLFVCVCELQFFSGHFSSVGVQVFLVSKTAQTHAHAHFFDLVLFAHLIESSIIFKRRRSPRRRCRQLFPANSAFTGPSLFPGFETSLNYFIKKKTFETSNARCTLLL